MAYAAGMLSSCGRHAIKYEIIEIKVNLHHKFHNKQKTYRNLDYLFKKKLNLKNEFSRKEDSSVPIGWSFRFLRCLRTLRSLRQFRYVHYVRCVGWK